MEIFRKIRPTFFFLHLGFTAEQSHLVTYPKNKKPADLHDTAAPLVSVRLRLWYPIMLCARKSAAIPFSRLPLCSLSLINSAARNKQEVALKKKKQTGVKILEAGQQRGPAPLHHTQPIQRLFLTAAAAAVCFSGTCCHGYKANVPPPLFLFQPSGKKTRHTHDTRTTRTRHTHFSVKPQPSPFIFHPAPSYNSTMKPSLEGRKCPNRFTSVC